MKTRFETNVAQEMPKTRMSQEPGLPWKLDPEELEKLSSGRDDLKNAQTAQSPLKTRAIFLIMLLVTIFFAVLYFVSLMMVDSETTRADAQKKEITVSSLQLTLDRINREKNGLNQNVNQMEKKIGELNAQKELFATVIESLTKKTDESQSAASEKEDKVTQNTPQAPASGVSQ